MMATFFKYPWITMKEILHKVVYTYIAPLMCPQAFTVLKIMGEADSQIV